jgi:hypothetical protein
MRLVNCNCIQYIYFYTTDCNSPSNRMSKSFPDSAFDMNGEELKIAQRCVYPSKSIVATISSQHVHECNLAQY